MGGSLDLTAMVIGLLGGVSLFLLGMNQMTDSLKAVAGDGMRRLLAGLTRNRVTAAFTGAVVTAVIQSSSVTTVLVVGFTTAGVMTLTQSVGVILGANVGTTITAQIIAFKVTEYAMALIAAGFITQFVAKQEKLRHIGNMVMGLGLIFFGMSLMSDATNPLRTFQPFIDLMQSMQNPLFGILAAAVFTALVQSSSATTGIVIVLASQGFITLEAGIALALGANVGTCVTAWLATLGKPRAAARAAAVHVIFNIVGVLLWVGLIDFLGDAVRSISPSYATLSGTERLAAEAPRQIANAHTLFNLANTFLFLWFTSPLANLVNKLLPDKPAPIPDAARPIYLDETYLETPALGVDRVRLELGHLGELTLNVFDAAESANGNVSIEAITSRAYDAEILDREIADYTRRLSQTALPSVAARRLERYMRISGLFNNISESVKSNLAAIAEESRSRQLQASPETQEKISAAAGSVRQAMADVVRAGQEGSLQLAQGVLDQRAAVYAELDELFDHLSERLKTIGEDRIDVFRLEVRLLEILRRLYFFTHRIAASIVEDVAEQSSES